MLSHSKGKYMSPKFVQGQNGTLLKESKVAHPPLKSVTPAEFAKGIGAKPPPTAGL
jgi:hypothetical protein